MSVPEVVVVAWLVVYCSRLTLFPFHLPNRPKSCPPRTIAQFHCQRILNQFEFFETGLGCAVAQLQSPPSFSIPSLPIHCFTNSHILAGSCVTGNSIAEASPISPFYTGTCHFIDVTRSVTSVFWPRRAVMMRWLSWGTISGGGIVGFLRLGCEGRR